MREERSRIGLARRRRIIASVLVATMVLTVAMAAVLYVPQGASATAGTVQPAAAPFRSLRLGQSGLKAVTINPNAITLTLEYIVVYNIYSTLYTSGERYEYIPDLAYRYEVARDNVTWTFHLVQNAYFTDPTNPTDRSHQVKADDVVFSYTLLMNNPASILASYTDALASVTKKDSFTVEIVTKKPYAPMLSTLVNVPILPQYLWEGIRNPVTQEPRVPVGSGAMYFDPNSALTSGLIILRRNPNYYGDDVYCRLSRPDEVRILPYPSSGTLVDDFKAGANDLHGIFNIAAPTYLSALPPTGQGQLFKWAVPSGFTGEVGINLLSDSLRQQLGLRGTNNQLLLNKTVRQAIAMSIDKEGIVKYAYQGLASTVETIVPNVNPWHRTFSPDELYKFDTAAARKLLNDAGWNYDEFGGPATPTTTPLAKAGGADPLIFRFYTPDSHSEFAVATANVTRWLHEAGIQTVDNRNSRDPGYIVMPVNTVNQAWKSGDYDLWYWDWDFATLAEISLDILNVVTTMAIPSITTDNWYTNPVFDDLYNKSLEAVDPVARRAITDQMQKILYDDVVDVNTNNPQKLYAATNQSRGGYAWEGWPDLGVYYGDAPDTDLPNLWFKLYPHDNPPPTISAFPPIDYVSGSPASINVIASDPNDPTLNYSWDFGDGSPIVNRTTNTVPHTYAQPGTYTIKVRVRDAEWPTCATTTATITAPGANLPPTATLNFQFPGGLSHGWLNESIAFSVTVRDPEGDPLYIRWDFGDGATATNTSTNTATEKTITQVHTYTRADNYTLTVTATDNQTGAGHIQTKTATIPIWTRPTGGPPGGGPGPAANPWISYGIPLVIALAIVIAVAAVLVRRRRLAKEEEAREEQPKPPPPT